jgi:predicted permease
VILEAAMEALGISFGDVVGKLWETFHGIVLPILLLAAVGWVIQRASGLDMATLRRLNFCLLLPVIIYHSIVTSSLSWESIWNVGRFTLALILVQGVIAYVIAWAREVPPDLRRVMMMSSMFHNCGNYGLPLQQMAFSPQGSGAAATAHQAFVVVTHNLLNFTLGIFVISGGKKARLWKENLIHIIKLPPLWAIAAGFITVHIRARMGASVPEWVSSAAEPAWTALLHVKEAFIAIALCTLGAQLGALADTPKRPPVRISVILRLLVGPMIGLGLIYIFGLTGFLAQVMLISSATPTAVNIMLLAMEFENHPDYAARAVFYSTLLSPITISLVILFAQGGILPGF